MGKTRKTKVLNYFPLSLFNPCLGCPCSFSCCFSLIFRVLPLFCLCRLCPCLIPGLSETSLDSPFMSMPVPDCPCMSLSVLVCPCQSVSVHVCPCMSLLDPFCSCLSLSVPVCLWLSLYVLVHSYPSMSVPLFTSLGNIFTFCIFLHKSLHTSAMKHIFSSKEPSIEPDSRGCL